MVPRALNQPSSILLSDPKEEMDTQRSVSLKNQLVSNCPGSFGLCPWLLSRCHNHHSCCPCLIVLTCVSNIPHRTSISQASSPLAKLVCCYWPRRSSLFVTSRSAAGEDILASRLFDLHVLPQEPERNRTLHMRPGVTHFNLAHSSPSAASKNRIQENRTDREPKNTENTKTVNWNSNDGRLTLV